MQIMSNAEKCLQAFITLQSDIITEILKGFGVLVFEKINHLRIGSWFPISHDFLNFDCAVNVSEVLHSYYHLSRYLSLLLKVCGLNRDVATPHSYSSKLSLHCVLSKLRHDCFLLIRASICMGVKCVTKPELYSHHYHYRRYTDVMS
jgi:hypothetical protein